MNKLMKRTTRGRTRPARSSSGGGRDITVVLFDYGGTLFKATRPWAEVKAEGMAAVHAVLSRSGLEMTVERFTEYCDSVFEKYAEVEAREDRDIPDRTKYQDIADALFQHLPKSQRVRLGMDANRAFWDAAVKRYPMRKGARRALKDLESMGLRMGVVSNHHDYDSLVGHLGESGIHTHFEVVLASEREGVRKPNTAIFEKSLKEMGVSREHAVFVGDSPRHDIVGARSAGITTILIDDGERHDSWFTSAGAKRSDAEPDFVVADLLAISGIVDSLRGHRERRRLRSRRKP